MTVSAISSTTLKRKDADGNDTSEITGYSLSQQIEVRSSDVQKVAQVAREATELINQGILIESAAPKYYYTQIGDLKIEMLGEAAKDAKERASRSRPAPGNSIGSVRSRENGRASDNGGRFHRRFRLRRLRHVDDRQGHDRGRERKLCRQLVFHLRRAEPDEKLPAGVSRAAVIRRQRRGICIERRHSADADINAFVFDQVADVADRICSHQKNVVVYRIVFVQHEFVPVLLHPFDAAEYRVFAECVIAFEKIRIRKFAFLVVLPPDECACPISIIADLFVVDHGRGRAAQMIKFGFGSFGIFQVAV